MTKNISIIKTEDKTEEKGFTLIEVLVSIAVFSFIVLAITSFFFSTNISNTRLRANREAQENARRILDAMTYEIKGAKSIYTPTTTATQLSLETTKYLPVGESLTFIDFFICGTDLCLKKESQNPIAINSNSVEIVSISFTQISKLSPPPTFRTFNHLREYSLLKSGRVVNMLNNRLNNIKNILTNLLRVSDAFAAEVSPNVISSIQITATVRYKNPQNDPASSYSITLTSTASLRGY